MLQSKSTLKFKQKISFDARCQESRRVLSKYPERTPVICEKHNIKDDLRDIDKTKYLVPKDLTVSQFMFVIRKRMSLPPEKAIFIYVNKLIPSPTSSMYDLYTSEKDRDNFLYMSYLAKIHLVQCDIM